MRVNAKRKTQNANLVNLNVNPCKMCMPMGAVSALSGIKSCMTILHGSQGCATYIRRHMATHYNEPIDIASSSLTEEGTVFGGEANLLKGLKNLIDLYDPEVIGVCTTCLAETIGEDVGAIVRKFRERNPDARAKIVGVSSPGYGATQNEGWFAALRATLEQLPADATPNERVNVVTPQISPADARRLKGFLSEMGVEYILLPDISDNLDGVAQRRYSRLKTDGTPLSDIAKMAGAQLTIEFSEYTSADRSPAEYLRKAHGVPVLRLPLPVGIRAMDMLINALEGLGGTTNENIERARGRYLDAMVDSHKYCAEARAAIFGEPDFVRAMVRLCCENGILPAVVATASVSDKLKSDIVLETRECRDFRFAGETPIVDDSDFAEIERLCQAMNANLLIGSSDARRIAHKLRIPLIRCAFPIHDFVGGQRVRTLGFEGSLNLLDQAANAMLSKTETSFRTALYRQFFGSGGARAESESGDKTATHPCFDAHTCKNARVHLPVAPKCNVQCNYCLRSFDCVNESRPGVSSVILAPSEALARYADLKGRLPNLTVVGIAGPGDALANLAETRETLRLIREYDPNVTFCIATNGLMLPQCAETLRDLGVSHVTVTVNAVDPAVGARIHRYVHYMGKTYTGIEGASVLLANQLAGIKMLVEAGVAVKVNCVALKGINDAHICEVMREAARLGAFMANIMPHIPVRGSAFEALTPMTNGEITALREQHGASIKQMTHCRRCRSDAAGSLDEDVSRMLGEGAPPATGSESPDGAFAYKTAVFTDGNTRLCDFFDASRFLLFEKSSDNWVVADEAAFERIVPSTPAQTRKRVEDLLPLIDGCAILAGGATSGIPYSVFDRAGLHIFEISAVSDAIFDGMIEDVQAADSARDSKKKKIAAEARPIETDMPGVYLLDLIALRREYPEISSKKAMADFLETTPFSELRLICDHVPPWIENSGKYDVRAQSAGGAVNAIIARRC